MWECEGVFMHELDLGDEHEDKGSTNFENSVCAVCRGSCCNWEFHKRRLEGTGIKNVSIAVTQEQLDHMRQEEAKRPEDYRVRVVAASFCYGSNPLTKFFRWFFGRPVPGGTLYSVQMDPKCPNQEADGRCSVWGTTLQPNDCKEFSVGSTACGSIQILAHGRKFT
jgi:hypothetical protein